MRERLQFILDHVDREGSASYDHLAKRLAVSTMTIRRDVDDLTKSGALIRIVGGVQKAHAPSYLYETAIHSRLAVERQWKRAIAREALARVGTQQSVFIDGSTTCLELAKLLATERKGLTLVTNSALACIELGQTNNNTIIGIGGQFDANSLSYIGAHAEDWARTLFVDLAFVGTKGFIADEGTFESFMPTFRIKQIIAQQAVEIVLLVDHSKFRQRALCKVLDVSQIHTIITDAKAPRSDIAQLERNGRIVQVASLRATAHVA